MTENRLPQDPRLSPISLRKELLADGLNDRAIARLLRDGVLHRVRRGAYVAAPAWQSSDQVRRHGLLARAVLKQACTPLVLSHLSAMCEWDVPLWDLELDSVHATRPDQRAGRHEAGVHQHLGALRDVDVVEHNGVLVTSPTRTALDSLTILDAEHGMSVVSDLLHRGLTTPEALEEGRRFMERWPHTLSQDLVLRLADGRFESVGEARSYYLIWKAGLPRPVPQLPITDRSGLVIAYVDFAWPEYGVFLEFDGRTKYDGLRAAHESAVDVVLREKRREERICEITGWRCIRITWADLYYPERTAARIRSLLERAARAS